MIQGGQMSDEMNGSQLLNGLNLNYMEIHVLFGGSG